MPLILNIDTALEKGFVALSEGDKVIASQSSGDQKEHASFLQPAVKQLMMDAGKEMPEIDAVAVTIGPGSYTGLRVGLASAKGICYALQKPLIAVNTLKTITLAAIEMCGAKNINTGQSLFCPMIDARRMEVFTAIYDGQLNTVIDPVAMILEENSFEENLAGSQIVFAGNGMGKFHNICNHPNAVFVEIVPSIAHLAKMAATAYQSTDFADLAYTEPFYAKAFHSTQPTQKNV